MPAESSSEKRDWWQVSLEKPENIQARKDAHQKSKGQQGNPNLCLTCSSIPFEYLLFGSDQTGLRSHNRESVYLGTLKNIYYRAMLGECPFCDEILIPKARRLLGQLAVSPESIPPDDFVSVMLQVSDNVFSRDAPDSQRSNGIYVCIKTHGQDDKPKDMMEVVSTPISNMRLENSEDMSHPPVYLLDHELSAYRSLRPRVDLNQCRRWFSACRKDHDGCKQTQSSNLISSSAADHQYFKLIDVKTRQVVKIGKPGPSSVRYATLSYVCGEAYTVYVLGKSTGWEQDSKGIERHPLPPTLPQTIEDSLRVTAKLGLNYLWVDSICIAQDNKDEKQAQILAMYHIYALAEVCIVAAPGNNSLHGLPGVTASRKLPGSATGVTLRKGLTVGYPQASLDAILKEYRWIRRAWTYQEVLLARRCLFFTETEAFFFCGVSTIKESLWPNPKGGDPPREFWTDGNGYLIGNVSSMIARQGREGFRRDRCYMYGEAVEKYTQRELSFQQDGINAFRGMEGFFGGLFKCETLAGCPESMLVNCLTWTPEPINSAKDEWPLRRMSLDYKDEKEKNDLHHIPLLPSWAWAAWKCASRFRKMAYYFWGSEMKILKPSSLHPLLHPNHGPYEFSLEEIKQEESKKEESKDEEGKEDENKPELYFKDLLPVLTKVSHDHFQTSAHPDYPGFVTIFTKTGEEVGECDVRGMLDTSQLTKAQDAVMLQIWVEQRGGKGTKCLVMLVRLHSLSYNDSQDWIDKTSANAYIARDATAQCMDNMRLRDKMKGNCPDELIVPRIVPDNSSQIPLLATRLGIGMVDFEAWRESKPRNACVILA